jgi:hypothetical protein
VLCKERGYTQAYVSCACYCYVHIVSVFLGCVSQTWLTD